MAKAPPPGVGRKLAARKAAQTEMTLTVLGETHSFCPMAIPFGIRAKVRKATGGIPFINYMNEDAFDLDSLIVCVWVARMVSGEPDLTVDEVESSVDWAGLTEDDFDVTITTPDDADDTSVEDAAPNV